VSSTSSADVCKHRHSRSESQSCCRFHGSRCTRTSRTCRSPGPSTTSLAAHYSRRTQPQPNIAPQHCRLLTALLLLLLQRASNSIYYSSKSVDKLVKRVLFGSNIEIIVCMKMIQIILYTIYFISSQEQPTQIKSNYNIQCTRTSRNKD